MWIYCKTTDGPKKVGEFICRVNSIENDERRSWIMKDEGESETYIIEIDCRDSVVAMVYRIGTSVIVIEVDDDCAPFVIEPLIERYGFDNVKWLLVK
jgi:hypothetical protein